MEECQLSREQKKPEKAKAKFAPMGPKPGMSYPGQSGIPHQPEPAPETQSGYCPGFPTGLELAQAYIPIQPCGGSQYDLAMALEVGTLYPELYRPYNYRG
jgi:hypothetical protein